MADWKEGKSFLGSTNFVEHQVNGQTLRFHPVSVTVFFRLRKLAKPIATAVSTLFFPNDSRDVRIVEQTIAPSGDDPGGKVTTNEPVSPEIAIMRDEQRSVAIAEAIDALTSDENADVVGEVIMDSLRDLFPRRSADNPPAREFMQALDACALAGLLIGVAKANAEVLGPLGKAAKEDAAGLLQQMQQRTPETAGSK